MPKELAYMLVGDHLGQVKKVLYPSGEISLLAGCSEASSSNPVVNIESIGNKQLIAKKQGQIYVYDCIEDSIIKCRDANSGLIKALPLSEDKILYVHDKQIHLNDNQIVRNSKGDLKIGEVHNAKLQVQEKRLALVGKNIPLKIYDVDKKTKIFDAEPPEKNWLGIKPDVFVSGVEYVNNHPHRIATCSKSDSVIRVYDSLVKPAKPVISINIDQTAFNEHADSNRFVSIASANEPSHSIVVGSNVGQLLAIDLRFNIKKVPVKKKKKLQPNQYKILGGFKGSRGASIKDIKVFQAQGNKTVCDTVKSEEMIDSDYDNNEVTSGDTSASNKVISCSLDRYLRIYNFSKVSRYLEKHVYLSTKPFCCSPVFYDNT